MYRTVLFILFLAIQSFAHSENELPLSNTDGGSLTIVNNCVNVISGDYMETSCDLVLKGAETLTFERFYSSSCTGNAFHGWRHNHNSSLNITYNFEAYNPEQKLEPGETPDGTNTTMDVYYSSKEGRTACYHGSCLGERNYLSYSYGDMRGFTNIGNGIISARNQLKNSYIINETAFVLNGENGSKSYFEIFSKGQRESNKRCYGRLFKDKKSSGNTIHYEYKNEMTNQIKAMDSKASVLYSSLKFKKNSKSELANNLSFDLHAHDGRKVTYNLKKNNKGSEFDPQYLIKQVIRPNAPYEKYEYRQLEHPDKLNHKDSVKISKKRRPCNRFLGIEYHEYGTKNKKLPYQGGRVAKLFSPVGFDEKPVMTHEFLYTAKMTKHDELENAVTKVFNAKRHLTAYGYSKDYRIDFIEKYRGVVNHQRYTREKFIWSDQGNLKCHYIRDEKGAIQAARSFEYDGRGNVLKDSFFGNLQGGPTNITLNRKRYPNQEGCNSWSINYRYNTRDLLLEEVYPNGKSIQYSYYPERDLVASKFTLDNGQIKIREFYDYDQYALVCRYTIDDGVTCDKNDLTGVSDRKIKCTLNQLEIPVGLPIIIDEYYLNPLTGNEILIKRIKNKYSIEGDLTHRETYDSNNSLRYVESFEYDAHGNLISEVNPLQQTTIKSYNRNDELISERSLQARFQKEQDHDYSGRVIRAKEVHDDGSVFVTSNVYDHLHNLVATIDPFGHETAHEYDEFGRLIKTTAPTYIDPLGNSFNLTVSKSYDIFGNVIKSADSSGRKTKTQYNSRGQPIEISYPGGATETFRYNDDGTLRESVGKNGLTTKYTHDCFGRLLKKELYSNDVFLNSTSSTYNSFYKLTDTDALGQITYYSYDYSGKLKSISKNEALTEFEYDELQRLCQTKQWTSKTSYSLKIQEFDLLNRLIEERMEDESGTLLRHVKFVFDSEGNQIEVIQYHEAGLSVTRTDYDSLKRPIKITEPEGQFTSIFYNQECYNSHGQRVLETTTVDPLGNQTCTMMNIFGKPESVYRKNIHGQLISKKEIGYGLNGNISFTIETAMTPDQPIRKVMTKYDYNEQDNVVALTEAAGTTEQKITQYEYNLNGEKIRTIKPDGQVINYSYNALGQLLTFDASDCSFSYLYEYDDNGNLLKCVDSLNNQTTLREYDHNNLMIKEVLGTGIEIKYSYDLNGRPTQVILPDDSSIQYAYNPLNLKTVKRFSKEGKEILSHEYASYDLGGNLLEEQYLNSSGKINYQYGLSCQLLGINSDQFSETLNYDACKNLKDFEITKTSQDVKGQFTYDDLYQLKSEEGVASHQYTHDSLNNCITKDGKPHETNALNQLLKAYDKTYTYDGNGNRISDGTKKYSYDALDRLIAVATENEKIFYSYDSFNRRLSKTRKNGNAEESTTYLYFGQNEVGSYDEKGNLKEFRVLGTGKGAEIGATVAVEIADQIYFPFHDHNGNIVSLIDSQTLKVVENYRFTAFGEEKITDADDAEIKNSKIGNPWRFSSKRVDEETGFVNFGRRYYDSKTAKWMSPDPIGFEGGPNLYAYVMNNPLTNIDLYGLEAYCSICGRPLDRDNRDLRTNIRDGIERIRDGVERIANKVVSFARSFGDYRSQEVYYDDDYEKGFKEQSRNIDMTCYNKPALPGCGIGFMNGMAGVLKSAVASTLMVSDYSGGFHIDLSLNQTHGVPKDLIESYRALYNRVATKPVRVLHERWREFFEKNPDGHYLQICHSQGAIHVRNALMTCPAEWRERLHVLAIAPAAYIDKGLCASVRHYTSERDFVPLIDVKGRLACKDTTTVLKPHKDAPILDHEFASPTYSKVIQQHTRVFIRTYGK